MQMDWIDICQIARSDVYNPSRSVTLRITAGGDIKIQSSLEAGEHSYVIFGRTSCAEVVSGGCVYLELKIPEVAGFKPVVFFEDQSGGRIDYCFLDAEDSHVVKVPDLAQYIRFGFRIAGPGSMTVERIRLLGNAGIPEAYPGKSVNVAVGSNGGSATHDEFIVHVVEAVDPSSSDKELWTVTGRFIVSTALEVEAIARQAGAQCAWLEGAWSDVITRLLCVEPLERILVHELKRQRIEFGDGSVPARLAFERDLKWKIFKREVARTISTPERLSFVSTVPRWANELSLYS